MEKLSLNISDRLQNVRKALGLSQREFAAEIGVTNGAIALWESKKREVPGPVARLVEVYEAELGLTQNFSDGDELDQVFAGRIARNLQHLKISTTLLNHWFRRWLVALMKTQPSPIKRQAMLAMVEQISAEIGRMKGLPMKLAQTLSHLEVSLPPEFVDAFSELQTSSTPVSKKVIHEAILNELGQPPELYFAKWSQRALVSASIGQVHRARLNSGEEVVVKIQYPGIRETIDSDFNSLCKFERFNRYLFQEIAPGDLLLELKERLIEECDYKIEARHQELFYLRFKDREGIKIPKIYHEHCSQKVLVSEFSPGRSLADFLRTSTEKERQQAGETIWQVYFESWLRYATVQVDPHPGNFLFEDGKVVFLDFGCMKEIPKTIYSGWREIARSLLDHQFDRAIDQLIEIGMYPRDGAFNRGQFLHLLKVVFEPYLSNQPYTFNTDHSKRMLNEWFVNGLNSHVAIRRDWIFLTRIIWGLSALLAKLGATANWKEKLLTLLYADFEITNAQAPSGAHLLPRQRS